jgi:hypothetical protein
LKRAHHGRRAGCAGESKCAGPGPRSDPGPLCRAVSGARRPQRPSASRSPPPVSSPTRHPARAPPGAPPPPSACQIRAAAATRGRGGRASRRGGQDEGQRHMFNRKPRTHHLGAVQALVVVRLLQAADSGVPGVQLQTRSPVEMVERGCVVLRGPLAVCGVLCCCDAPGTP